VKNRNKINTDCMCNWRLMMMKTTMKCLSRTEIMVPVQSKWTLVAYQLVLDAQWVQNRPKMSAVVPKWMSAEVATLDTEIASLHRQSFKNRLPCQMTSPDYVTVSDKNLPKSERLVHTVDWPLLYTICVC